MVWYGGGEYVGAVGDFVLVEFGRGRWCCYYGYSPWIVDFIIIIVLMTICE